MAIYTTERELEFIDSLGRNSTQAQSGEVSRNELLRGYIAGAQKRSDWGDINKALVVHHAKQCLVAQY